VFWGATSPPPISSAPAPTSSRKKRSIVGKVVQLAEPLSAIEDYQPKGLVVVTKPVECSDIPLETFSKVVESVYDCALDTDVWQTTIGMIANLCRSHYGFLGVIDLETGRYELTFHVGYDKRYQRLYEERYGTMNPYLGRLQLLPVGTVATRSMLVDEPEFVRSQFYKDFVKPQKICDAIGFNVLKTGHRIALLVTHRLESQGRYGYAELNLLSLLAPHVCRSAAISHALDLQTIRSEALKMTLDALMSGVYLTDRHGRVVYMNPAAERQVKTSNALRIANNRLMPSDSAARLALTEAIAQATADEAATPSSGITLALPGGENMGLVATILPLNGGQRRNFCGIFAATVAIFVQDPIVAPLLPGEALSKLYNLTGSEIRVLLAMSPGLSVKEAAEILGISETTAKTHIQHIHMKTGTYKQTELIHLLMRSEPPLAPALASPSLSSQQI
jgi:DNA-binding CsgD family transcriptional regulator/PAS domain-containing protein